MGGASGSTIITNVYGYALTPGTFTAAGGGALTISNYYALYLGTYSVSGSITTTNRYGIYQADTSASNVFGGSAATFGSTTVFAGTSSVFVVT